MFFSIFNALKIKHDKEETNQRPFVFVGKMENFASSLLTKNSKLVPCTASLDCLVGLAVKASASRAEDPGFESRLRQDFSRVESYQ